MSLLCTNSCRASQLSSHSGASSTVPNLFAYGLDLEAVRGVLGQGLNTRQGDLMTIKLKSDAAIAADMPTEITVYLMAQTVVELSDSGTNVLDQINKKKYFNFYYI